MSKESTGSPEPLLCDLLIADQQRAEQSTTEIEAAKTEPERPEQLSVRVEIGLPVNHDNGADPVLQVNGIDNGERRRSTFVH